MKFLPIVYLVYMFISFYLLSLFLFLYFNNRKHLFDSPDAKKNYSVSFVIPAWNEEETINETIEHIFAIDYANILEVIVVNDCSTDKTKQIVKKLQKKYPKLILIDNKRNIGKANSNNRGLACAKAELVAIVDADSYPAPNSLKKMVGFFNDEKVGAVTCPVLVRSKGKFIERLQEIEYRMIAFTRKLLDFVDSIYVTPGPLALYRKKALDEINGFDNENFTEDIEIVWNLIAKKWDRRMALSTKVTTTPPDKLKSWYKQRLRWAIGGLQCISKYKKFFLKKGMLGMFVLPFFMVQFFLGLLGFAVFIYLIITKTISNFLFVKYSVSAGVSLITMNDFYVIPNFLNYLGITLFVCGLIFTFLILSVMKGTVLKKQNIFHIAFYSAFYLTIYPIIALHSVYKYFKGGYTWR